MANSGEGWRGYPSRRVLLSGAACAGLLGVAACGRKEKTAEPPPQPNGPTKGSLQWAIEGPWRAQDRARDAWRHPAETLRFFGLQPRMTVVDFWPGGGWYTEILAPYLAEGAGKYIAAGFQTGPGSDPSQAQLMNAFQQRFTTDRELYGEIQISAFGPTSGPVAEAGTADLILFMRQLHAWMAAGIGEKAFADAWLPTKIRTPSRPMVTFRKPLSGNLRPRRVSPSSPPQRSTPIRKTPRTIRSASGPCLPTGSPPPAENRPTRPSIAANSTRSARATA
jgi:hypothetical protein